ncbi:penicillin-binding protein [Candidatus Shapirobacteria bacterium CG09_land_8_20_14_0_10_38_17]|uniref:Penicillin-binding protein n=1 Tax=Candidatus Shapirobacteria bacterium CG09_land_8_20_14_0_10_38_17 TaxID=1974884 RepID=A0A2H0WRY4_9BACT|nr:MAG: penicillin-binding protein [Candidatus Shapirobacteria bacterium CG09_land_8_20_14_0_10_38_17]
MDWFETWRAKIIKMRRKRFNHRRIKKSFSFKKIVLVFLIFLFVCFLGTVVTFAWLARDLPQPGKVVRREGFATRIYDRNGQLLYDIYQQEKRTPVSLEQIPESLRQATIAVEDEEFYQHQGFSLRGIGRALYNIVFRRRLQGGSTLTQQLVKNVLLSPERTLSRKIREFILAIQIEAKFSKDEILEMYLNEAPYGGTARGVEAASELYFDKSASKLSLVEAAILAGFPQSPTAYSPFGADPEAYVGRAEHVLRQMSENGYITQEEEEKATKELSYIEFAPRSSDFSASHFVMYVKKLLVERFGEEMVEAGGLKVTTTLDLDLQEKAEEIVAQEIEKVINLNITNGGAVVLDPKTGEILAMVGSRDYNEPNFGKVNVTLALRQPGSAIKPVTYVAALKRGYTAAYLIMDTKTEFPGVSANKPYVPVNYDGKYHGPMQVRFALGNSINLAAVKMLAQVGLRNMLEVAYSMGLSTLEPTAENLSRLGLSVTLGGGEVRLLELVSAYSAFANGGFKIMPVAILKVENKEGEILEEFKPSQGKRVLTSGEAFIISDILADNNARLIAFGPNSALNIAGLKVAVKTGTTNDMRDNWTVGWTPQVMTGVWVGNNDNSEMKSVASGITGAAPIWRKIILAALEDKSKVGFSVPEDVVTAEVDEVSGARSHDGFPSRLEYFIKGTESQGEDRVHLKLKICKSEGKLASPLDITRGDYEEKEFFVFSEEDLFAGPDGENRWQKGIDEWVNSQGDSRYHSPTEYCSTANEVGIQFEEPNDRDTVQNEFKVKVKPLVLGEVEWVKIYADDREKQTFNRPPYEVNLVLSDGPHKVKAKVHSQDGKEAEKEISIGVNVPWNWSPTPTPTPTLTPTPGFSPSLSP